MNFTVSYYCVVNKTQQLTYNYTSWLQQYSFITQGQLLSVKALEAIQDD